jgi:hypothetical protein
MNQPPAHPPNQPEPGPQTSSPSPLPPHQAGSVTQQPDPSVVSRPPYTHPTPPKDELPPAPIEQHPLTEAEYQRPIPRPGDRDWVAGSPATDYEADATEKEAKARLAAGRGIYEEYGHPIDYEEKAGEEGRDEAGRIQSPDRDTQARLRYEDEVRRSTEVSAGRADEIIQREEQDRQGGPNRPGTVREHDRDQRDHDREAREAHEKRAQAEAEQRSRR